MGMTMAISGNSHAILDIFAHCMHTRVHSVKEARYSAGGGGS
jgi:hypothetical protein